VSAFAVLQLTILLLWATNPATASKATIPAASLDFAAACILCVLSSYEHTRTVAPSSVIGLYVLASLISDIARLRTLFLLHTSATQSIGTILALSTAIKLCVIFTEAASKRHILLDRYRNLPLESTSNVYSKFVFWWLNGLLRHGSLRVLQVGDLYEMDESMSSTVVGRKFQQAWNSTKKTRKHALLMCTSWALKFNLVASGIPRLLLIGLKYAQPFLLSRTISYVGDRDNQPANVGWGLVGAYAIIYIGLAILTASYNHLLNRSITRIRGGLVSLVYTKTLDLSLTALDESAALTLISADVQRITDALIYLHDSWGAMIEIGIAVFLLCNSLGLASIAPAMVFLGAAIVTAALAKVSPRLQKRWVESIQTRVSFTSSLLGSMRSVRLEIFGLTDTS
jgi:ATP-binding cassette, subfamily C (CFTR/MRP), member 1